MSLRFFRRGEYELEGEGGRVSASQGRGAEISGFLGYRLLQGSSRRSCYSASCLEPLAVVCSANFPIRFLGVLWTVGMVGVKKMLVDFAGQSNKIKKQHLVDPQTGKSLSRYHYLWFIGTDVTARGRGLASHLIRLRQKIAKEDGLPMWLEATTAKSRDVYAKCGFRVMGEIQLGVGTHATTGFAEKGGSGLVVYAMMWRSEWEIEGQEGTTVKTDP